MKQIADKQRIFLPCLLIIGMVVLCLLISHPYNFVPILSCLMFFGAVRPRQEYVIPLLALIGTDILLTEIQYAYPLTADAVLTWLWYLEPVINFG